MTLMASGKFQVTIISVATVQTGVFANLSNKIAKITGKFENVVEAKNCLKLGA